jgi:hypothetical protein
MSGAETLRAAAKVLRDTASNATPGPWTADEDEIRADCEWRLVASTYTGDLAQGRANAAWGALMSPDKAEHLFRWLADAANDMAGAEVVGSKLPDAADPIEYCDEPDSVRAALAFARTILGRDL